MPDITQDSIQQADLQEELTAYGKRLALLLAASPLPEEIQLAWAELIPEMDLEQMDELSRQLEQLTLGGADSLQTLEDTFTQVQSTHEAQREVAAEDFSKKLEEITNEADV